MEAREHNSLVSEIANTTILLSQCVEIHQRNKLYMWLFVSVSAVGICGKRLACQIADKCIITSTVVKQQTMHLQLLYRRYGHKLCKMVKTFVDLLERVPLPE